MKRKLYHKDRPLVILERTEQKMRSRDITMKFQWDLYFLSNSSIYPTPGHDSRYNISSGSVYNKYFHRKGNCLLKTGKTEEFKEITLTLTGDHLIYSGESGDDSDYIILLSEALLYSSKERINSFEIRSNNLRYVIS